MFSGAMRAAAKGSFAVDVVCISGGATLSTTEFLIKFAAAPAPGARGGDADIPLQLYCNKSLCASVTTAIRPSRDRTVHFKDGDGESDWTHFPSPQVLRALCLHKGRNAISCGSDALGYVEFCVYLWDSASRIVVVDVDGTLTRSNVRGYVETVFLGSYDYIHAGVVLFLLFLDKMGLQILYLTARPRSHVEETRELLRNMTEDGVYLPAGPLFTHRGGRMTTLYMELVTESTASFKLSVMVEIADVHRRVAAAQAVSAKPSADGAPAEEPPSRRSAATGGYACPFFLGIGNKDTDATAYYSAGILTTNIFIMQKSGEVVAGDFAPRPEDILAHHASRAASAQPRAADDAAAAVVLAESLSQSVVLTRAAFSSYSDPRLLSYAKQLILSSRHVLSFGGMPHEQNEGLGSADV